MTDPLKIDRSTKRRHAKGGFRIETLLPGLALQNGDSGVGAIGRIDHSTIAPGTVVPMHPHRNDEILTYLRSGKVLHTDSEGNREEVTPTRLMLMNAGRRFQHEEHVSGDEDLEGLQVFIRPRERDLEPAVQFHDFGTSFAENRWRLVAGPSGDAPLRLRANAWVHDVRLGADHDIVLPPSQVESVARLVYVFRGRIVVSGITLGDGDSLLLGAEDVRILAGTTSDLLLFTTDTSSAVFAGGGLSANVAAT